MLSYVTTNTFHCYYSSWLQTAPQMNGPELYNWFDCSADMHLSESIIGINVRELASVLTFTVVARMRDTTISTHNSHQTHTTHVRFTPS